MYKWVCCSVPSPEFLFLSFLPSFLLSFLPPSNLCILPNAMRKKEREGRGEGVYKCVCLLVPTRDTHTHTHTRTQTQVNLSSVDGRCRPTPEASPDSDRGRENNMAGIKGIQKRLPGRGGGARRSNKVAPADGQGE